LNKALKKGFKVSNDGVIVSLKYTHVKLTFDRMINARDGCMTRISMKLLAINNINRFWHASISKERTYLYKLLGLCGKKVRKQSIIQLKFLDSSLLKTLKLVK
jgi:hypothetical protein